MKTTIQELMDEMQKSPLMFASALALIEEMSLLDKEKEVITDAYESGQTSFWSDDMGLMGDWYYNETFNNELLSNT